MHEEGTNIDAKRSDEEEMFDVIICGTDLIQSILSSALSRAGKKVLHCDGHEWYGGFDAVLHIGSTMDSFIQECDKKTIVQAALATREGVGVEEICHDEVNSSSLHHHRCYNLLSKERQGDLRIHSQTFCTELFDTTKTANNLGQEVMNDTKVDIKQMSDCNTTTDSPSANDTKHQLDKGLCLDLNPTLLYASGDAVDGLVKSGVSEYLEFKSLKGLYILMDEEKSTTTRKGRYAHGHMISGMSSKEIDHDNDTIITEQPVAIHRVPCSKNDVFSSELLSPVEKRRLMKFLQLIMDYGMATQGGSKQSSNTHINDGSDDDQNQVENVDHERADTYPNLTSGEDTVKSINERHLHRGRALSRPQNKAMPSSSEMNALSRAVHDNIDFSEYLTRVAKLPTRLSNVILYAMALASYDSSEQQYSTKDGVDDLIRHLAAIGRFGDTAFLVPMYGSGELSQAFCRSGAVYGSVYMLRRSPTAVVTHNDVVQGMILRGEHYIGGKYDDINTDDVLDKSIPCKHVIISSSMLMASKHRKTRIYRRISILQGKLILDQVQNETTNGFDTEQRHAIIIPPGTNGLENPSVIHGVAVDESAFVAPPGGNHTILHLTTSSQEVDGGSIDELSLNAISKAVTYLIAKRLMKDGTPCRECHHISFSYSIDSSSVTDTGSESTYPVGLHICHRGKQSLTVDSAFREARRIFENICPDADFLGLARQVEDQVVYRHNCEEDDEKNVLESACAMIQAPTREELHAEENVT